MGTTYAAGAAALGDDGKSIRLILGEICRSTLSVEWTALSPCSYSRYVNPPKMHTGGSHLIFHFNKQLRFLVTFS